MKSACSISLLILSLLLCSGISAAQEPVNPSYKSELNIRETRDTLTPDTFSNPEKVFIVMSPDSIDAKVDYGSVDSNYLDNKTRKVHLYGKAYVRYKDLTLDADYIVIDLDSSIAVAEGSIDSAGATVGKPEFKMGEESFTAERIRYNFRTRKGFIYNVLTEEGDLLIHGAKTKFVAGGTHPNQPDDILYNEDALITSCDHPEPHYGVRAKKVKTIPDKLAVVGPSNLEIFGVPTPLILPFGFYPVPGARQAGVIFPRDYERSPRWGFGLKDFGYYFPVRDWADVRLTGDIYFNGSWGLGANTNYIKKYKYRGSVDLRYSSRLTEADNDYRETNEKSFSIRISHNQDPKAHPYQTIGGSVNIQSNDFESLNYNDARSALTNTYSSNFNYSRIFPGKPYSFSASMNHSQNTRSHLVTINAPDMNFRLNRIYPFKSKTRPGDDKWFEKIAFQYSANAKSQILTTDTTLFEPSTLQNAQWGAQHKMSSNVNFNVLKYFNVTPSIDYGETWFFKTQDYLFRFEGDDTNFVQIDTVYYPDGTGYFLVPDTISYGEVAENLKTGFSPFRTMSASVNMNTQIFGTKEFAKGWLRGIRHVIKPSIGFSYSPKSPESYYQYRQFHILQPDTTRRLSRFNELLYSVRPVDQKQANINYSINNIFEAKYFSKRDSTEKKLKLFDNISATGSYNLAAKHFKFSPLNISGHTRFFKGITTVSVGATYSFYGLKEGRLDTFLYLKTNNKLLRFDNLRLRFSTSFTLNDILGLFKSDVTDEDRLPAERSTTRRDRQPAVEDKFFDLFNGFFINHEMGVLRAGLAGKDTTLITTHSVNLNGSMRITSNWSVNIGNIGYDFQAKQITYPDIGLSRDLHCWELAFNFQPDRGTYSFHIGVKPGSFDFLKFPYRRGNYDSFGF